MQAVFTDYVRDFQVNRNNAIEEIEKNGIEIDLIVFQHLAQAPLNWTILK